MNLRVRVQPRAKRNALVPWQDGQWKLSVTAPAVEGKANEACVEYMARTLGIPRSRVRIVSGEKSRNKVVALDGVSEEEFRGRVPADRR
jgi:uncharacterized protein (TIGR00251 family)